MRRRTPRPGALWIILTALICSLCCLGSARADDVEGDSVLFVPGEASEYGDESVDWTPESQPDAMMMSAFSLDGSDGGNADGSGGTSYNPITDGDVLTGIRAQGSYGTCWAISAMACAELSGLRNSLLSAPVNLSEWHLDYFATHQSTDPLGNCSGDYNTAANYLHSGNIESAMMTLAAWRGPADETATGSAYESISRTAALADSAAYTDALHLRNAYLLAAVTDADRDLIKQMVLNCGGVTACFNSVNSNYRNETVTDETGASMTIANYYQNTATRSNHEVTIVGWDDNYSAANFKTSPGADGAFLCMNSWGSSWGDNGYFWLSYYDTSLTANSCAAYEYDSASVYDHNYQYDGSVIPGRRHLDAWGDDVYYANVFTAAGNADGGEQLKAASTYTYSLGVPYDLYVYTDLQDAADPTSGTLAYSTSGTFDYVGFHTVSVDAVSLWEGETFSVVFRVDRSQSGDLYVPTCYTDSSSWFSVNDVQAGQSFLSGDGDAWTDAADTSGGSAAVNVRAKAYTSDVSWLVNVTLDPNGGTVDPGSLSLYFGAQYSGLPTPTRTNWTFLGWFTDPSAGDQVTGDSVVRTADAHTLYAHWQSNWTDGHFTDVSASSWYAPYVKYCWENGLLYGQTDTVFAPSAYATRGQVVTVLYRAAGSPAVTGSPPFDDVGQSAYYAAAVTWAAANQIAYGSDDDGNGIYSFRPEANVTRQDFLCFLYRFAQWNGVSLQTGSLSAFSDASDVSSYALAAEQWSVGCGLQVGADGKLLPRATITRAEMSAFLARYDQTF